MSRIYADKVTIRPPPGGTPFPLDPIDIISVGVDPNGNQEGNPGDLALLVGGVDMWRCTGGFTWVLVGAGGGPGSCIVSWGNTSISPTTTTRFLTPWYSNGMAPVGAVQWRAPKAYTAQNLRVRHNSPDGNGNPVVYALRVNGVASTLLLSMASTASDGANLANTVAIAAGDLVDLQVSKAINIASSPNEVIAVVEMI